LALLAAISLVLLPSAIIWRTARRCHAPSVWLGDGDTGYVAGHHSAAVAIAVGTFGSSIPLAIYAATASARLRQLGITAPGATIALAAACSRRPASRYRA
jgi:hypothetical protein